jgi:hypothetical protein
MHPLPTSIHSSTDSPSLLTVRDFSMSRADGHVSSVVARLKDVGLTITKLYSGLGQSQAYTETGNGQAYHS